MVACRRTCFKCFTRRFDRLNVTNSIELKFTIASLKQYSSSLSTIQWLLAQRYQIETICLDRKYKMVRADKNHRMG